MPEVIIAEPGSSSGTKEDFTHKYHQIRSFSEQLAVRLTAEDMQLQSMPDASPAKWHLAHTTWFFENFLLRSFSPTWHPSMTDSPTCSTLITMPWGGNSHAPIGVRSVDLLWVRSTTIENGWMKP